MASRRKLLTRELTLCNRPQSFTVGGQIPISLRLSPLAKIKLYRFMAQIEQKTTYTGMGQSLLSALPKSTSLGESETEWIQHVAFWIFRSSDHSSGRGEEVHTPAH